MHHVYQVPALPLKAEKQDHVGSVFNRQEVRDTGTDAHLFTVVTTGEDPGGLSWGSGPPLFKGPQTLYRGNNIRNIEEAV